MLAAFRIQRLTITRVTASSTKSQTPGYLFRQRRAQGRRASQTETHGTCGRDCAVMRRIVVGGQQRAEGCFGLV